MKDKYIFETHKYAPELNKCYTVANGKTILYPLPETVTRFFNSDYKSNIREVRAYQKMIVSGFRVAIEFTHSYEAFNNNCNVKKGRVKNAAEILEFIRLYKSKNEGKKDVFIRFDSNDNPIYKTVYNTVSYNVTLIK